MKLSGWSVPIEYLSASSIAQFIACPEQFRLRRLKRIPESKGVDQWIGTIDHNAHSQNLGQKITSGVDLSTDEMHQIYDAEWEKEMELEGEPEWYENFPDEVKSHGHLMVETFHEVVSPTITPIAVESRFEERVKGVPIPIVGYVDVEETGRLIERKTSKARTSKPKPGWLLQGRIYSLIYQKPVEWQIITKAKTPTVCMAETDPGLRLELENVDSTVLLLQQAATMMNDCYNRYGEDRPWPLLGVMHTFQCSYCFAGPKYANNCVAWNSESPYLNGGT